MSTLHDKLVAIQSELKAPKSQTNTFGKYKYRSCEDILEAVKPLLATHRLVLSLSDEIVCMACSSAPQAFTVTEWSDKAKQTMDSTRIVGGDRFYVKATATVSDGENSVSTVAFAREEEEKKGMDGSQITGAASSYARKYALNGLFCIDDTKDADATNDHKEREPRKPVANAAPASVAAAAKRPATPEQLEQINTLCTEMDRDPQRAKEHFAGRMDWTFATADLCIRTLTDAKKSLSKQLDSQAA